jgi:hypothetical protein
VERSGSAFTAGRIPVTDFDEHERNQAKYYFRIVDPDFTPLPAYNAIKAYATQ